MAPDIDVGRQIAGKYELVRLIGKGAMGEVWLATHNTLGGEFAVKLVKPSDEDQDESAGGRFQLEAQISAKLSRRTRHIVSVSDHGEETDGLAYLVMELLEGESLEQRIKRAGRVALVETVAIVTQVARALEQAHGEGIFHRDLKPANIFLTKDEDGRLLVKLLDFGIARSSKPQRTRSKFATGKDMVLGTPSYMSPEQARGLDTLDHRCDVWALAVVAFEALTSEIPWEGDSVEDIFLAICTHRVRPILALRPELPPGIVAVFDRAFAEKLASRFTTAMELSASLEALVDPLEVDALTRGPASARRLPVPSEHDMANASAMALAGPRPNATDPNQAAFVGGPTAFMQRTNRNTSGWLVAAAVAVVTIVVILFGLRALTGTKTAAGPSDPPVTPATAASATERVPSPSASPAPVAAPLPTPATTPAPVVTTKVTTRPSGPAAKAIVFPPPTVVKPPPPVEPATATPPTARPAPTTPDKAGVF
ncbi:MAG: Serine/threonine protein kinase [Labilithrix sp.]|nr:Serine/threonine protein kinase [Labilithrix sp.]